LTLRVNFPVVYWEQNILFDRKGRAWGVYRVPAFSYAHLSEPRKLSVIRKLADFFYAFQGRGQLLSVTREVSAEEYTRALRRLQAEDPFPEQFLRYLEAVKAGFQRDRPWRRELYLVLELPKSKAAGTEPAGWLEVLRRAVGGVEEAFLGEEIPAEVLEAAVPAENRTSVLVQEALAGVRALPEEITWLIRRPFFRALGEPEGPLTPPSGVVVARGSRVRLRPRVSAVLALADGVWLEEGLTGLRVHHGRPGAKTGHQAGLVLADVPEEIEAPGMEYLFWLDDFGFPVDVSVHFEVEPPHSAARRLYGKRKELRDQEREYLEGGDEPPAQLARSSEGARVLQDKLAQGMPLLWASTVFWVAGATLEEAELRAAQAANLYNSRQFRAVRPPGDALRLFLDAFPASEGIKTWMIPMDPWFLAAALPHGTGDLGDPAGFFLGTTPQGRPVLYNPGRPMQEKKRSGAVGILGTLGGGKSMAKKYILYTALLSGAAVLDIDPKGEDHVFGQLPGLGEAVRVVRLAAGGFGFNPLAVSPDPDRDRAVAQDFLGMLLETRRDEARKLAVYEALERAFLHEAPDLGLVEGILADISRSGADPDQAREAGRCAQLLGAYRKSPFGRLIFGGGQDLKEARMVVFDLSGLPLPKKKSLEEGAVTENERLALSVFYLVAAFARETLLKSPRGRLKIMALDEAWALLSGGEGRRLLEEIIRMGRSFNIVPLVVTQNPGDIAAEEIRNNLGLVMAFRLEDAREIRDAAAMLGLDPDDQALAEQFRSFSSGRCFFKDIEGRVGLLQVEPTPVELLEAFDTTPRR